MKELSSTCSKGLEVPCQNTFSWYIAAAAKTMDSSESHYA